jgi:CheY-like chemotaxis protein
MQMVDQHQPDLILLDIMMPRMSGYEVCSQLKGDASKRMIPVLIVTALNEPGDIEKAVNAGCDDFLTKPVNRLELRTRVRSLLRVRHLSSERDRLLAYLQEMEPGCFAFPWTCRALVSCRWAFFRGDSPMSVRLANEDDGRLRSCVDRPFAEICFLKTGMP